MTFKFIAVFIPSLFLLSSLKADDTKEKEPIFYQKPLTENTFQHTLKRLQEIHNFHAVFDDCYLGGIPYEAF